MVNIVIFLLVFINEGIFCEKGGVDKKGWREIE